MSKEMLLTRRQIENRLKKAKPPRSILESRRFPTIDEMNVFNQKERVYLIRLSVSEWKKFYNDHDLKLANRVRITIWPPAPKLFNNKKGSPKAA